MSTIEKEQEALEAHIEEIELHESDEDDIVRIVEAMSAEGLELRRQRKRVRYILYRIQNNALGKCNIPDDPEALEIKEKIENAPGFGGWKLFSETWDVSLDDPFRCVHKDISMQEEWAELVSAKYPQLKNGGGVHYPDIKVKKAVEAEAKLQQKLKEQE